MNGPRIGSLCTGVGAMDLGVMDAIGGTVVWHSQYEPPDKDGKPDKNQYAARILEHRFPGVPNHGDIKAIDWSAVEPIDVLTAGYPCQPFSLAGLLQGVEDPRHIWPFVAAAVGSLRPALVVFENVANHLNLGFDVVLRDLDRLGYDAYWQIFAASDIGAPHQRKRLFILGVRRGTEARDADRQLPGAWESGAARTAWGGGAASVALGVGTDCRLRGRRTARRADPTSADPPGT